MDKLGRNFKEHKHFEKVPKNDTDFVIKHYAGDVRYNCTGFLDKNKDLVCLGALVWAARHSTERLYSMRCVLWSGVEGFAVGG